MKTKDRQVPPRRQLHIRELNQRVRQHGGILEAIEWGIRSDSIDDPELATVWRGIEAHYEEMRHSLVLASRMLASSRHAA
jgi:hypothetical protein